MFEKFTHDARTVVTDAQKVARRVRADRIEALHLLIAMIEDPTGVAGRALATKGVTAAVAEKRALHQGLDAEALASLGIDLDQVIASVDETFGPDALTRGRKAPRGHLPFSREAKKTLEIALREAIRLGDRSIDSGHLLLAVIRLKDIGAHRALLQSLTAADTSLDGLRATLEAQRQEPRAS